MDKLCEIFFDNQFWARNRESIDLTMETEKQIKNKLHQLMKLEKISGKIYHRLKEIGLQRAEFYGFAYVF